jgi:hypothetical protein
MTHEAECLRALPADRYLPCICGRLARVRADERERAAGVVRQYAADTHPIHNRTEGCPRCYIAAALLVAANHVDGTAP